MAQCQLKKLGFLFRKQKERATEVLKYKASSFYLWSLSQLVFYLILMLF